MPIIGVYSISDVTYLGPDPWLAGSIANSSSPGNTTFTLNVGAVPIQVDLVDGDTDFDDADNSQDLAAPATINGTNYSAGQNLENEYAYGVRPLGSTDPADQLTIYAIDEGGATPTVALAATNPLIPGVTYEIISVASNNPTVAYTDLFVCFADGTLIRTPTGEMAVEDLRAGDHVLTLDRGAQPVLWVGRRRLEFGEDNSTQKPIGFKADSLGNGMPHTDLQLSPQHRVLVDLAPGRGQAPDTQALAPAVGFERFRGVRRMNGCHTITYNTILLPQHEVIFANGAAVESLYPTGYAMSLLSPAQQQGVRKVVPDLTLDVASSFGPPARQLMPVRQARAALKKRRKGWSVQHAEPGAAWAQGFEPIAC